MGPYDDHLMRWVTEAAWRRKLERAERERIAVRSRPKRVEPSRRRGIARGRRRP